MEEQEYDEILTYLSKIKYPDSIRSKDNRSNWRKKCRPFTYCKEELFYNHKKYGALRVVKGIKEKRRIIETSHLQPDNRHHGINRTLKKISANYYWRTIAKDVHSYVKVECKECVKQAGQLHSIFQQTAPRHNDSEGELHAKGKIVDKAMEQIGLDVIGNILEPSAPSPPDPPSSVFKYETTPPPLPREHIMAQCGLDVVGPLTETHKGRRFIVVLTDCITKWSEAAALSEFTTEAVGAFLAEVVCRHGAMEELLMRHGQEEFCARLSERVCALTGLTVRTSALPAGEHCWYNSLLCGALVRYSSQHQYSWDVFLPLAMVSYRTFPQKGCAASPFQLLYGRPPRLPAFAPPHLPPEAQTDEQAALVDHMATYIKALAAPPHHIPVQGQAGDRLTPPYQSISEALPVPTPPTQPHTPASVSFGSSATVSSTSCLSLASLGSQQTAHTTAAVYTIPGTGLTTQTMCANSLAVAAAHPANTQANHLTPAGSSASPQQAASTHLVTSPTPAAPIIVSASQPTPAPSHPSSDTHSGHMVMIHTDGKTYADSYYLICPQ